MAQSKLIAATAAEHIPLFADWAPRWIAAVVMVSTFSGLNGSMMTGPRIFFAMRTAGCSSRRVPRFAAIFRVHPSQFGLRQPWVSSTFWANDFAQLADKFILGIWPFYALAVAGVYVLRRKRPDLERPYRVLGYPVVPALFLLASLGHGRQRARN